MNNFKLLKETRTFTTLWAVPQDVRLEDMNTSVFWEYCLTQVTQDGQKIDAPKVQQHVNRTLELEELSAEEQEETIFQPEPAIRNPTRLDCVIETVETLLVPKVDDTEDGTNNVLEKLELLKRWIDMRMLELRGIST